LVKSGGEVGLLQHGKISLFSFSGRDVTDGFEQTSMVEPVDPFQGCELDGVKRSPRPTSMDHLGLVKTVDGSAKALS
jgi:hypothetical protein